MKFVLDNQYAIYDAITELENIARLGYYLPSVAFNRLLNPLGQQPARGWFCVLRSDLNKIDLNGTHSVTFQDDTGRTANAYNMVVSKEPFNLTPGGASDQNAVFLLELADQRYLLDDPEMGVAVDKYYNLPAVDFNDPASGIISNYWADSLEAGTVPWTWLALIQDLWGNCNKLGSTPLALPYTPDGIPVGFSFPGMNCYEALNQVLSRTGLAILWNPTLPANQYSLVQIGAGDSVADRALVLADQNNLKIFDREYQTITKGSIPGKTRIYFQKMYSRGVENTTGQAVGAQYIVNSAYSIDISAPDTKADASIVHAIWDDLPALMDSSDAVQNLVALTTRAVDRSTAFYKQLQDGGGTRLHKVYSGILMNGSTPFLPGPDYKGVMWGQDLLGIGGETPGGLITEVIRHPYWMLGSNDSGQWVSFHGDMGSTSLRVPDYGPTDPNYPLHLQIVRVVASSFGAGIADSSGRFDAFVERFNNTALTRVDKEEVWAVEVNGQLRLPAGNYQGRLSGYNNGRPVYQISATNALAVQDTRYCSRMTAAISSGATTLTIESTALFPAAPFYISVGNDTIEFMQVTNVTGTTLTVSRAQLGSTAVSHEAWSQVCQVFPPVNTTLNGTINSSVTSLTLTALVQFPSFGKFWILVDSEVMLVTDGAGTLTLTVIRGYNSTAAGHTNGATIYWVQPDSANSTVSTITRIMFDDQALVLPGNNSVTTAVHHEVDQFVRVTSAGVDSNGYYDGFLQKWDPVGRKFVDDIAIKVKDANN